MIRARKYNMNKTKLSLSALSIPAVKSFHNLPAAVLESIQNFARHTHDYEKKIPEGPRDNNEYIFILSHMSSRTALKRYVGVVFFLVYLAKLSQMERVVNVSCICHYVCSV